MLTRLLEHQEVHIPEKIVLHETVDIEPQIKSVVNGIVWRLSFAEALWGLVGAGMVLPLQNDIIELKHRQEWTTVVPGGGGHSSGWRFDEFLIAVPARVRLAPSLLYESVQSLSDADLFLNDLDIPDIHREVEDALRQAVECFRHELYLPSLAMLGLASEGAWIELGLSLVNACTDSPGLTTEIREKRRVKLTDSYTSILQKLELVADLYSRKDVYNDVATKSGFNHRSLKEVLNWSNVVRDARNAVHYRSEAASSNTYEKVAALLLGANQNLRIIYAIRRAAMELS